MDEKKTISLEQFQTILESLITYIDSKTNNTSAESGKTVVSADNTSTIASPLSTNLNTSSFIYQNGLLLTQGTHYNLGADNQSITLIGYTASKDDIFTFINC